MTIKLNNQTPIEEWRRVRALEERPAWELAYEALDEIRGWDLTHEQRHVVENDLWDALDGCVQVEFD